MVIAKVMPLTHITSTLRDVLYLGVGLGVHHILEEVEPVCIPHKGIAVYLQDHTEGIFIPVLVVYPIPIQYNENSIGLTLSEVRP